MGFIKDLALKAVEAVVLTATTILIAKIIDKTIKGPKNEN